MVSSMSGVTRPMILEKCMRMILVDWMVQTHKLHIHVADVVIEMALDRIDKLKISEGKTQPIGALKNNKFLFDHTTG